jgi:hypothetical protein
MTAGDQKFIALHEDATQLVATLRQDAIGNERRKHSGTGPLKRGIALGYADALRLAAADRLETLIKWYLA